MADLKPIGSEKLTGQDKLNRIMEIARFNEVMPKTINETAKSEYSVSLADGNKYEIVRERQGYIIKKTISESETEYIEPMKNRKYYSSYSQAFKRLNLVAGELNRINENEEGISLYGEQKKFTLKTPKPAPVPAAEAPMAPPAAPPAVPAPELPPSPMDGGEDMGMEDMGMEDMGAEGMSPEGDVEDVDVDVNVDTEEGGEEQVTFKTIQKLTGKLTQKIRTLDTEEGMTSENVKYVINMVLSALDLTSLSEEDKEDIMSKFEEDETEDFGQEDDMGGEDMTDDSEVEDIQADMDVPVEGYEMEEEDYGNGAIFDSIFGESKVDKVISKYFEISKKEIRESKEKQIQETAKKKTMVNQIMESVVKMTETIEQELAAKKFVKENLNSKFVGITNKKNLVFETKTGQVRITPNGDLI
jgi:flagellar motor protein MotB